MAVKLSRQDFQQLVHIVENLPDFAGEHERRMLVSYALEGEPRAGMILMRLNLRGSPHTAAIETIRFLSAYGQVAYGK